MNSRADEGEEGPSLKHKDVKNILAGCPTLKKESVRGEGEEAGGSAAYARTPSSYAQPPNSKLNGHLDSIMELLAEIQTDIKANRRQFEKIEQVLASHTRAIESNTRQCEKVQQVLASHARAMVDAVITPPPLSPPSRVPQQRRTASNSPDHSVAPPTRPAPLSSGEPPPLLCSPGLVDATLGETRRRWGERIIGTHSTRREASPATLNPSFP